jgi:hypothetical protein
MGVFWITRCRFTIRLMEFNFKKENVENINSINEKKKEFESWKKKKKNMI